jgi:hypothetical protein
MMRVVDVGLVLFLMNLFHAMLHNLLSPAFETVVVSHKLNFSPEWLPKHEAKLATATTCPHLLSPT